MTKKLETYDDALKEALNKSSFGNSISSDILKQKLESINNFDYDKFLNDQKELERLEKEKEQERINQMKCPSCKSSFKEHVIKSESNGVFGPGYYSHVTEEYYVCKECGIMYKDLNKK